MCIFLNLLSFLLHPSHFQICFEDKIKATLKEPSLIKAAYTHGIVP